MGIKSSLRDKFRGGGLQERTKAAYTKSKEGGGYQSYFNRKEGIQFWKMPMGDSLIDVIPYFAGKHDPLCAEGNPTYVLEVDIHEKVGAAEEKYICPVQYGKSCPICEEQRRLRDEGADWDTVLKPLSPKKRCMYNVIVRDNGPEEKKGVQVLEISYHFLEKHIAKLAKNPRTGGIISFSDPIEGRSIAFNKSGSTKKVEMTGFQLVERDVEITEEDLENAVVLDELLKVEPYELIYEKFHQRKVEEDSEEDDELPPPPKRKKVVEEEKEAPAPRKRKVVEPEPEEEEDEDEPPPPRKRKPAPEPEPEEEEDEDEPPPPPKRRRVVEPEPPKRRKVVEPEPEEEEDEDEPPPPPKKKKQTVADTDSNAGYRCPVKGGLFGVNVDEYDECDDCALYPKCVDAG